MWVERFPTPSETNEGNHGEDNHDADDAVAARPGAVCAGRGVLADLGTYVAAIGSVPLILADPVVRQLTEATVTESFRQAGLAVR